jgi:hypothetical protein
MLAVEAVFLVALAASAGWLGASALIGWAAPFLRLPVSVDRTSLAFVLCLVVGIVGLTGFAPGWLAARDAIAAGLKQVQDGSVRHKRLRAALVATQVAISLALLAVSARGVRAVQILMPLLPPDADRVIVAEFNPAASHPGQRDAGLFIDGVLDRLAGTSSITAAGFADFVRANGTVRYWQPSDSGELRRLTAGGFVTPGWFESFGATFIAGRGFGSGTRDAAVINDAFASMITRGSGSALGQTLRVSHPPGSAARSLTVVGIVADRLALLNGRSTPAIYLPMPRNVPGPIVLVVRADDLAAAKTVIGAAVAAVDPLLPWVRLDTLQARALEPIASLSDTAWFGAALGTVALLLAATGLHAVLSYMVRRRAHEIGIRVAIGADRAAIVSLVLRQALGLVLAGVIGGLIITVPLVFVMRMFPDLSPFDPVAMLTPLAMLLVVALLAAAVPAYRAATVDPMIVLRES